MRILFLKFGALGDVLMTTPLIRQTRRAFPRAQLDYCVAEPFAVAVQKNSNLNDIVTFDPAIFTEKEIRPWIGLIGQLRARKYDLVFVLDKHWAFALSAFLARIPRRIGFGRDRAARLLLSAHVPYGSLRHEIHYYLDLLAKIVAVDYTDAAMEFCRRPADMTEIQRRFPELRSPYFACCNSGGENLRETEGLRRLPRAIFAELISLLSMRHPAVLLGNGQDREYYATLNLPPNVINLAGKTTIPECAEIISRSEKTFTTDCGLMHLAGTTEAPLCAFFGPTHPQRKLPLREKAEPIWSDEEGYDSEYELTGRKPSRLFFSALRVSNLAL